MIALRYEFRGPHFQPHITVVGGIKTPPTKPSPSFGQRMKPSGASTSSSTPSSTSASISSFAPILTFTKLAHTIGNLDSVINFKKRGEGYCNGEAPVEKRIKDAMVEKGNPLILEVRVWVQSMAKGGSCSR
ncbi:hypothetical protein AAZX31_20G211100 [Glycine max]|nr:hypothetical protein JHK86_057001 [Glycine max]KAG4911164.1 hypothetical protein JHK87_057280 [Glycine soja]KAG4919746.1 hypothetical protein JHK85_058027 [Glycine max]KHN04929.1 hypothetical protein glysoja_013836 [Glycine soja]